jgi:aminopeptidase C
VLKPNRRKLKGCDVFLLAGSGMMEEVYRITGICLGIPPTQFTWQYVDKAKQVRRDFSARLNFFKNLETISVGTEKSAMILQ